MSTQLSSEASVWKDISLDVPARYRRHEERFTRTGALPPNKDIKLYDVGLLTVGESDVGILGMTGEATVGILQCSYDVELFDAQAPHALDPQTFYAPVIAQVSASQQILQPGVEAIWEEGFGAVLYDGLNLLQTQAASSILFPDVDAVYRCTFHNVCHVGVVANNQDNASPYSVSRFKTYTYDGDPVILAEDVSGSGIAAQLGSEDYVLHQSTTVEYIFLVQQGASTQARTLEGWVEVEADGLDLNDVELNAAQCWFIIESIPLSLNDVDVL
jgi:hypothetical protein